MDYLFRADEQEFISPLVCFRTFLTDALSARRVASKQFRRGRDIEESVNGSKRRFAEFASIDNAAAENIYSLISVDQMRSNMVQYNFNVDGAADATLLPPSHHKSLKILQKEREKRRNAQYKSVALRMLKYDRVEVKLLTMPPNDLSTDCNGVECLDCNHNDTNMCDNGLASHVKKEDPDANGCVIVDEVKRDELVVSCSIFIGYNRPLMFHEMRLGRLLKVTDSILVTGESTLLDLKNAFRCPSDFAFAEDMSIKPPALKYLSLHQFPSSFFFINDTFYIDLTPENATDMTEVIREWAKRRGEFGELKMAQMDTKIIDLECRLGMPYVYVHQGQCEHLITFTDLRIADTCDPPSSSFPIKLNEKNFRRICCAGCKVATGEWVVIECERLPSTPCFVCDMCYREFHVTLGGNKVGKFIAVPYCDRKAMDTKAEFFMDKLNEKAEKSRLEESDGDYY